MTNDGEGMSQPNTIYQVAEQIVLKIKQSPMSVMEAVEYVAGVLRQCGISEDSAGHEKTA